MKLIAALFFAVLLAAGAVMTYPLWYGPLTSRVPTAARYLPSLASSSAAARAASTPIPLQPVFHSPAARQTPTATPLFTPPGSPSTADAQSAGSSQACTSGCPVAWAPGDCSWATDTLASDYNLDSAAAAQATDAATSKYYSYYAAQWLTGYQDAKRYCAGNGMPSHDCAVMPGIYADAINTHAAALQRGEDVDWQKQWIANYQRLESLWQAACG